MKKLLSLLLLVPFSGIAQTCFPTPSGDQTSYGTGNRWIGYVYNNANFTQYYGFVREGTITNPNFDQNFGGSNTNYATSGCAVNTNTFSVRYKLTKTFAFGTYDFTVGGDDGYRLSLDGGVTWLIDRWFDQSYNTTTASIVLNGTYNMVLEFYENTGDNRVSFAVAGPFCAGTENTAIYGTGNIWNGYVYDGTNFNAYKGMVQNGTAGNMSFDENFGGSNTTYTTSSCGVQTETFSVRYRLRKTFANGNYSFTVGGDDGYRFSLDGGATWAIDNWNDHSYTTSLYTTNLNGTYDMVLEFYENGGDNRISISMAANFVLPVHLVSFSAQQANSNSTVLLKWQITENSNPAVFVAERSTDGMTFTAIGDVPATNTLSYRFTDNHPPAGIIYYRLRMTDQAGQVSYSGIATVHQVTEGRLVSIYPTVATSSVVNIKTGKSLTAAQVHITDLSGKLLLRLAPGRLAAGQVYPLNMTGKALAPGIYLVQVYDKNEKIATGKIVIP
ncbi:MAG TPA: T9SS type A sorting domain-containing protein [Chitinophagaceae bacterium]|nr:T9SS type A sorting domain-containing protein [Chitinophagaceae bacterium]